MERQRIRRASCPGVFEPRQLEGKDALLRERRPVPLLEQLEPIARRKGIRTIRRESRAYES